MNLMDLGLVDDEEEIKKLQAAELLKSQPQVDTEMPQTNIAGLEVNPEVRDQVSADNDTRRKLQYVSALQEFLSPGSSASTMKRVEGIPDPEKRAGQYADILKKYQESKAAKQKSDYLTAPLSAADMALYKKAGLPVDEGATYGQMISRELGPAKAIELLKNKERTDQMMMMLGLKRQDVLDKEGREKALKEEEYMAQTKIPGMDLQPGFKPPSKSVEDVRTLKTTVENMDSIADKLSSAIDKMDTGDVLAPWDTEIGAEVASLANALNIQAKEYNKLGVLNGPDMMILTQQIGDPSTLKGFAKSGGKENLKKKLKILKKGIREGFNTQAKNTGFNVNEQSAPSVSDTTAIPPGATMRRKRPDGTWEYK